MLQKEQRNVIRKAAAKLFFEQGYENTTIRDIAKATGMSSSVIYYYFDSKEEVLYQLVDETLSAALKHIRKIEKSEKNLEEKITSILKEHTVYVYAMDEYALFYLVHDHKSLTAKHKELLTKKRKRYAKVLVRILDELKAKGMMVDMNTTVCAFAFFGMVSWTYRWYDPKGKVDTEELSEVFRQIFTKGIFA